MGNENVLQDLAWKGPGNANNIAALMLHIALVQHANEEPTFERPNLGWTSLTYEQMMRIASLSKAKVAAGLDLLQERGLIKRQKEGRRLYCYIQEYEKKAPWAKLPAKSMYDSRLQYIPAFAEFTLRNKFELHALKLFLLIVARRDTKTNHTHLTYDQLSLFAGINGNDIKRALMFLSFALKLVLIERIPSKINPGQVSQAYRLEGLEPRRHMGTTNAAADFTALS